MTPQAPLPHPWYVASPEATIVVATRDAACLPAITRGLASRYAEDGRTLVVYLPLRDAVAALANIADNGAIAVVFAHIYTYRSVQVKGAGARVIAARPDDEAYVAANLAEANRLTQQLGAPPGIQHKLFSREVVAVAFVPEGAWDQTPGSTAGTALPP